MNAPNVPLNQGLDGLAAGVLPNQDPNPLAAGGVLPATNARLTTFRQFYSDATKDPCGGRYDRIMARFDASRVDALPSATLMSQVVGLGSATPQAYLLVASTSQGPRIYCAHLPSRFFGALDGTATPWDNQAFAFLGDVVRGHVTTINFPEDAFDTVQVWVKMEVYMQNNQQELDEVPLFPPNLLPDADDPDLIQVTVRKCMYLPAIYVPLFLSAGGYSIKQVWDLLPTAILQRQEMEVCAPLLRWLQAASTGTPLQNPLQMGAPAIATTMHAPPADEALLTNRHNILHQVLPHLAAPSSTIESALSQVAAALIVQTNDTRQAREQKAAQDSEPKLPSDRFKVTLPVLLEYLQVQDENDLPPIWHRWSNCTKKQELQVLRDSLDSFARSADAFSTSVPVVTARLVQDLLEFNFLGQSVDDIKSGFQPFIVSDGNAENRQANMETARLYGLITAGEASITLGDLELLSAKEVRSVPLSYWELEKALGMFGNLVGVILGPLHPLSVNYKEFWTLLRTNIRDDLQAAIEYRGYVKPTHILRSLQLIFYTWFMHRKSRLQPPVPDMKSILHQILLQTYILPNLPPALYKLAYPKRLTGQQAVSPPGTVATASLSAASSATKSIGSDGSTISGLTTPTTVTTPSRGSVVVNLQPNAALQAMLPSNFKIKELIGTTSPPQFDAGGEMCLSFLTRNTCWSNCRRAANHRADLTPSEQQRLESYIETQKQAYNARRTRSG
jgi:hypothetical protein